MWHLLDAFLMAIIVLLCSAYAVYSLSSVRVKRVLLSWLVRCFGIRVFSVLSPRIGGCNQCAAGTRDLEFLRKPKQ